MVQTFNKHIQVLQLVYFYPFWYKKSRMYDWFFHWFVRILPLKLLKKINICFVCEPVRTFPLYFKNQEVSIWSFVKILFSVSTVHMHWALILLK